MIYAAMIITVLIIVILQVVVEMNKAYRQNNGME